MPSEAVGVAVIKVMRASVGVGRSSAFVQDRMQLASTLSIAIPLNLRQRVCFRLASLLPPLYFSLCKLFTRKLLYRIGLRFMYFSVWYLWLSQGANLLWRRTQTLQVAGVKLPASLVSDRGWNKC